MQGRSANTGQQRARPMNHRLPMAFILAVATALCAHAAPTTVYYTGFEAAEGYDSNLDLAGQQGWVGFGSGGNGLVSGFFGGYGQQAYIGYSPPAGADNSLSVWRPVHFAPVPAGKPVVHFTVLMAIIDSTAARPYYDDFRWSVYNSGGDRLFSVDFDNDSFGIHYVLDNGAFVSTGRTFTNSLIYELSVRMDFARNEWSATLSGQPLVAAAPITTTGLALNLGDIDAVWSVRSPGLAGDNYMVFDEYRITADVAGTPPEIEALGRMPDGQFLLRLRGSAGVQYALEATTDLVQWTPIRTNTTPTDGVIDYIDTTAPGAPKRFYRARVVP